MPARTHHMDGNSSGTGRRSIRLEDYDYASAGAYFLTFCTLRHECLFGEIIEGRLSLNAWGRHVTDEWEVTALLRKEIILDAFVVMPDHVHGILIIHGVDVGAHGRAPMTDTAMNQTAHGGARVMDTAMEQRAHSRAPLRRVQVERDQTH